MIPVYQPQARDLFSRGKQTGMTRNTAQPGCVLIIHLAQKPPIAPGTDLARGDLVR
jgi:hypothetical protein